MADREMDREQVLLWLITSLIYCKVTLLVHYMAPIHPPWFLATGFVMLFGWFVLYLKLAFSNPSSSCPAVEAGHDGGQELSEEKKRN